VPDGAKISFQQLSTFPSSTPWSGVVTNLTNVGGAWALEPAWSPDGTKIAYRCCDDDDWEIYVMNADGTGKANLTNSPGWDSGHAWSPDGTQIAFNSGRDGNDEIYVMTPDGQNQTRLTTQVRAVRTIARQPELVVGAHRLRMPKCVVDAAPTSAVTRWTRPRLVAVDINSGHLPGSGGVKPCRYYSRASSFLQTDPVGAWQCFT
jgi:dipeptidyl aminopeptidase/acylaminoacyl peptidase